MEKMFTEFVYHEPCISNTGLNQVTVTFKYKGKVVNYYYFSTNKSGCLKEAKREIAKMIKDNQLKRYAERYIDYIYNNNIKRKSLIGATALLAVGVVTGSVLAWHFLSNPSPDPGPVTEYVNLDFTSESCNIKDKDGKDVSEIVKGETFEGIVSLNQEAIGYHLPSALNITMNGEPVPLSDYEFNPYTGEFSIIPTGDIKISVEQDNSDAMFIYECAEGTNTFALSIIPGSDCKIDWGDEIQTITTENLYTHTYEGASEGERYTIKVSGVDSTQEENTMVQNKTGERLVSAAYFDNAKSYVTIDGYGDPSLLEELYFGKNSEIGQSLTATNLHTIIVDEDNEGSKSFGSNIVVRYNMDGEGVLKQGCSRSVIPENENIVDIDSDSFKKSKIKEINIHASVKTMLNNPFKGADYLTKITVNPDSEYFTSRDQNGNEHNMITTKKASHYFEQNEMMVACNTTTIPEDGTVKTIGEGAYCGLSSIINIDVPDCIEKIDGAAINDCPNIEHINIQSSSNLTKFFHGTVEFIYLRNKGQLNGCSSLKSVTIPANVTHIAYDSGSTTYDFPLFDATNTSLTEMIVLRSVPPTLGGKKLFDSSNVPPNLSSIYVPDASVDVYKGASGWSAYTDLIKPISERPTC